MDFKEAAAVSPRPLDTDFECVFGFHLYKTAFPQTDHLIMCAYKTALRLMGGNISDGRFKGDLL